MSPEQAQGNKEIDYRSDLWAIGVIAFECLLGERPFASDGLGDLVIQICIRDIVVPSSLGTVPPGFDAWFKRAVAREPELRFQSARELSESLREALGLARDPLASAPESLWSIGPSLLERQRSRAAKVTEAPVLEAPPPSGFGLTRDESPKAEGLASGAGGEVVAMREKMLSETLTDESPLSGGPRRTSWEVIPHGESPTKAPSIVPPRVRVGTTIIVIIAALALGALLVLGLEDAGISLLGDKTPAFARKKSKGPPKQSPSATKKPTVAPSAKPKHGSDSLAPSKKPHEANPAASASAAPVTAPAPSASSSASVVTPEAPPLGDPSPALPDELEQAPAPPAPVAPPVGTEP